MELFVPCCTHTLASVLGRVAPRMGCSQDNLSSALTIPPPRSHRSPLQHSQIRTAGNQRRRLAPPQTMRPLLDFPEVHLFDQYRRVCMFGNFHGPLLSHAACCVDDPELSSCDSCAHFSGEGTAAVSQYVGNFR